MSKILTMAKDFNTKSKQQANAIEQQLTKDFKMHEKRIQDALKANEKKIIDDISAQQQRLNRLILKTWIWLPITLMSILIACWGILWWQGQQILDNQQKLKQQQELLKTQSNWGITFHQEEGVRYIVLPLNQTLRQGWRINEGQEAFKITDK